MTSFTFALVSSVAVSAPHLRTLPQALDSEAKQRFHISHHMGLHRSAHCALNPQMRKQNRQKERVRREKWKEKGKGLRLK